MMRAAVAHHCGAAPTPTFALRARSARDLALFSRKAWPSFASPPSPLAPFHRRWVAASSMAAQSARSPPALSPPPTHLSKFKVALCQLGVTSDKAKNIAHVREKIESAADAGAKLIVLPEIWNSPYTAASFPVYAEDINAGGDASPSSKMLSEVAKKKSVTIIGGSIPERSMGSLYNTCCIFGSDGELKAKHRKVHLFDIDIPGKMTFKESETLSSGDSLTIVDTEVGRIAVGICYDIRFAELAMIYAARGAQLICYPGAFNMTTGPLHWELLTRARAADNQLYVLTCSPARDPNSSYVAWGHSTVAGPFGEIIATTGHEEATIYADIDYSLIGEKRTFIPLENQRRGDLYCLVDVTRKE